MNMKKKKQKTGKNREKIGTHFHREKQEIFINRF